MKRFTIFLLTAVMILTLAACGNSGNGSGNLANGNVVGEAAAGPVYKVDVKELDPDTYPADYPLIAFGDFESAFKKLSSGIYEGTLDNYQDVVDIFGVDGAYYENCDMDYSGELYKYYGWYADNGVSVLVTFKADGNNLKPYAYTGNGIN
jgi:hypothetical protein